MLFGSQLFVCPDVLKRACRHIQYTVTSAHTSSQHSCTSSCYGQLCGVLMYDLMHHHPRGRRCATHKPKLNLTLHSGFKVEGGGTRLVPLVWLTASRDIHPNEVRASPFFVPPNPACSGHWVLPASADSIARPQHKCPNASQLNRPSTAEHIMHSLAVATASPP